MRRLIVAVVLASALAGSTAPAKENPAPCTVTQFRAAAHRTYLPWDHAVRSKAVLHRLKACAPNTRTRVAMRRTERHIVRARAIARRRMLCGSPSCNQRLARYRLRQRGQLDQWPCLRELGEHESGWDAYAVNQQSGAIGIPQALGHGAVFALGDADAQIRWLLDYIDGRYGTPCNAWAFWSAHHWY